MNVCHCVIRTCYHSQRQFQIIAQLVWIIWSIDRPFNTGFIDSFVRRRSENSGKRSVALIKFHFMIWLQIPLRPPSSRQMSEASRSRVCRMTFFSFILRRRTQKVIATPYLSMFKNRNMLRSVINFRFACASSIRSAQSIAERSGKQKTRKSCEFFTYASRNQTILSHMTNQLGSLPLNQYRNRTRYRSYKLATISFLFCLSSLSRSHRFRTQVIPPVKSMQIRQCLHTQWYYHY